MTDIRLRSIKAWCMISTSKKSPWFKPWHRGYEQACLDILLLLNSDVIIKTLSEYRAVEGLNNENS